MDNITSVQVHDIVINRIKWEYKTQAPACDFAIAPDDEHLVKSLEDETIRVHSYIMRGISEYAARMAQYDSVTIHRPPISYSDLRLVLDDMYTMSGIESCESKYCDLSGWISNRDNGYHAKDVAAYYRFASFFDIDLNDEYTDPVKRAYKCSANSYEYESKPLKNPWPALDALIECYPSEFERYVMKYVVPYYNEGTVNAMDRPPHSVYVAARHWGSIAEVVRKNLRIDCADRIINNMTVMRAYVCLPKPNDADLLRILAETYIDALQTLQFTVETRLRNGIIRTPDSPAQYKRYLRVLAALDAIHAPAEATPRRYQFGVTGTYKRMTDDRYLLHRETFAGLLAKLADNRPTHPGQSLPDAIHVVDESDSEVDSEAESDSDSC